MIQEKGITNPPTEVTIYSPWHTGTPTEEGWYLLKCVGDNDDYEVIEVNDVTAEMMKAGQYDEYYVAYMPITPYEGEKG